MSHANASFFLKGLIVFVLLLLTSCLKKEAPPFPYGKKYTVSPTKKPFEFSQADTIQWQSFETKTYDELPLTRFDWDKLESKRLEIGFPYPVRGSMDLIPLNLDSIPSMDFDLSSFESEKLDVRVVSMGKPEINPVGNVPNPAQATRGVRYVDDGFLLPNSATSSISAKDGSIWIGTQGGYLARYNSDHITLYGPEQGLEIGNISSIIEDSSSRLWLGSNSDKVVVMDLQSNLIYELESPRFFHRIFQLNEISDGTVWTRNNAPGFSFIDFKDKTVTSMGGENSPFRGFTVTVFEDSQGLIWTGSSQGVQIIDRENKRLLHLTSEHGLIDNMVYNIMEDDKNRIWLSTASGISVISSDRKGIFSIGPENGLDDMDQIFSVIQSSTGKFWFGTGNSLVYSYDEEEKTFEKYQLGVGGGFIFQIFEDQQGQIWAVNVNNGGLYYIDQSTGQPANIDGADGLDRNRVWGTLIDDKGRVWIGTEEGLEVYNPKTQVLWHIGQEDGLIRNYVYNLMLDSKGRIWAAGTGRGISIIDPEARTIKRLESESHLNGIGITEVYEDESQTIWLGGFQGHILRYRPDSSEFLVFQDSLYANRITDIVSNSSNEVFVGTQGGGLLIFNQDRSQLKTLNSEGGLISDGLMSLDFDSEENLWLASLKGVERIDIEDQVIGLFTKSQDLLANDVYAIKFHEGKVYAGTSSGIGILDPYSSELDQWTVYTVGREQGMTEVDISQNSFSFDPDGYLWAGSNALTLNVVDPFDLDTVPTETVISGLNILDETQDFFNVDYRESIIREIDSIWKWQNNEYSLLSAEGRDSLSGVVSQFKYQGTEGPERLPMDLTLNHGQNFLSFNYHGSQFKNPKSVMYTYILEGIDKNWSPITSETRSENYRDLPPGKYTFKVASKGYNNIWSDPAEFSFTILPPWWKTRWAYALYILLVGGAIYGFVQYRSRWLKRENRLLEERVNQRTAQLKKTIEELETTQGQLIQSEKMASLGELTAGIAHEIQNPMNFINNFSEVSHELLDEMMEEIDKGDMEEAKEISNDIKQNLEKISHHGHRASSIVRGMLEHSRNSSGQKEDIDINVLADEYLRLAYHGLRAKDKSFNAKFETDFDDSIGKIEIIPQDIGRVMLNLINNAFYAVSDRNEKETDESYQPTVKVTTKKLKDQVKITVEDNGSGIPQEIKDKIFQPFFTTKPSGKGTGLGLSLTYDIITQGHGGALELDSEVGKGTVFTIFLPVKQQVAL